MISTGIFAFLMLSSLGVALNAVVQFYVALIIVWAILSWFNQGKGIVNDIHGVLDKIVSPYIGLFRRFIPTAGGMDFSPIVAILLLQFALQFVIRLLG